MKYSYLWIVRNVPISYPPLTSETHVSYAFLYCIRRYVLVYFLVYLFGIFVWYICWYILKVLLVFEGFVGDY